MSLPRVAEPPGKAIPYVIPAYQGEALNIPGSKSTVRVLASAKESENSISVFHLDGILGDPVVFHHHNEAHDIFMCTKGNIKVWAGDKCRVLGPGDFCSVPPKVVHRPQLIGTWNETVGLVTPGTWVDFFRFASEKYDGLLAEEFDNRNTLQFLIPKFQSMKDDYDVIPHPDHPICEAGEWTENDTKIPDGVEAYYLRADSGPRHLLGGILSRPFITTRQSGGKFAITCIESSSHYPFSILESPFTLQKVHQIYHVLDGAINVIMNRVANQVRAGETVLIPAGTEISISFVDRYVRFWSYTSGDGLETFVLLGGREYEGRIVPNKAEPVDTAKIQKAAESINMDITAY